MNDWFDFNYDMTIKNIDFTKRAARGLNQAIDSEAFVTRDFEVIYEYLLNELDQITFKDYLKRYLYIKAGISESYEEVPNEVYGELIRNSFQERQVPLSAKPTTKRPSAIIKDWLNRDSVHRDTVFQLGFGLGMSQQDVSDFLTKVLREEDFDMENPTEVIFWYCFKEGVPYVDCQQMIAEYPQMQRKKSLFSKKQLSWAEMQQKKDFDKNCISYVKEYLLNLKEAEQKQSRIQGVFEELYDRAREVVAKIYREDGQNKTMEEITPADLEKMVLSGVPINKSGNLEKMSASRLAGVFANNKRVTRQRIVDIQKGKFAATRFDLITLLFFVYAVTVERDWPAERCIQYQNEMNQILAKCHMMPLYPANPYEAFVLMCLISEDPMSAYAEVWELSYKEE